MKDRTFSQRTPAQFGWRGALALGTLAALLIVPAVMRAAEVIDQEYHSNSAGPAVGINDSQNAGQTLSVGRSGVLTKVELEDVSFDGTTCIPAAGLTATLYKFENSVASGTPVTDQFIEPSEVSSEPGGPNLVVTFSNPVSVEAGEHIAIELSTDEPTTECSYAWVGDNTKSDYRPGIGYTRIPSTGQTVGIKGVDFGFVTFVDDTDSDEDGVFDGVDSCPTTPNADQADSDGDGMGDVCDMPDDPTTKDECKNRGWLAFGFKNQGQCMRFVNTGQDSRL